jgi:hypothetical protein
VAGEATEAKALVAAKETELGTTAAKGESLSAGAGESKLATSERPRAPQGVPEVGAPVGINEDTSIQFGRNENQFSHTFRHTDALGLDRMAIQQAIEENLAKNASAVVDGVPYNAVVEVGGKRLQYTAFRLKDKTLNVGRIHEVE